MLQSARNALRNWTLRHLCNAPLQDDFLQVAQRRLPAGNVVTEVRAGAAALPEQEASVLGSDARSILKMSAWPRVRDHMRSEAIDKMVNKSTNTEDMYFSKAILYTLDAIDRKFRELSNI